MRILSQKDREIQRRYKLTPKGKAVYRAATKRYRQRYPDRYKAKYHAENNWKKYGLTEQEWIQILSLGCGICGTMKTLVIDHDHTTNKVRGALCTMHNTALGKFGDDPNMLRKAIRWLEK